MVNNSYINHLAIIMDGNSRWAKQNNLPYYIGHKKGAQKVKQVVEFAIQSNIKHLSLFAFSTENWQRPTEEVNYLIDLLDLYLSKDIDELVQKRVKLAIIGDFSRLSDEMRQKIHQVNSLQISDIVLHLYVTFSYGGRQEIIDAARKLIAGNILPDALDADSFKQALYAPNMPDIDLVIRTGGNKRISNFLLWHCAYAELHFIDKYWPDFDSSDFIDALQDYNKRLRTFGSR